MSVDLDSYRQQSRQTWGQMARGWEARREWLMAATAPVLEWLQRELDAQPGQTVLELAAGTGDLGLSVSEQVGDQGRVISTDFAPEMVQVARRNGEARGAGNVEFRVLDAERMDLADDSVDAVVCRWGYMLMADPARALKETRRVLVAGGPLCFAVWRAADSNPWAALPGMTLMQRGHVPAPDPAAPGMFALGDGERTQELARAAGFSEPRLDEVAFTFSYRDFDDYWDAIVQLAGPLARVIEGLDEPERAATREAVREGVASFARANGSYEFPAASWCVRAS